MLTIVNNSLVLVSLKISPPGGLVWKMSISVQNV